MTAPTVSTSSPSGVDVTAPQAVTVSGALASPSAERPGHLPVAASTVTGNTPLAVLPRESSVWQTVAAVAAFLAVVALAVGIAVIV